MLTKMLFLNSICILVAYLTVVNQTVGQEEEAIDLYDLLDENYMPEKLLLLENIPDEDAGENVTLKINVVLDNHNGSRENALNTMRFHRKMMNEYFCRNFLSQKIFNQMALVRTKRKLDTVSDPETTELHLRESLLNDEGSKKYQDWLRRSTTLEDIYRQFESSSHKSPEEIELVEGEIQTSNYFSPKGNYSNTVSKVGYEDAVGHGYGYGESFGSNSGYGFVEPELPTYQENVHEEHPYVPKYYEKKKDTLTKIFEIALTALAFLSFGTFLIHVLLCLSMVGSHNYMTTMSIMSMMTTRPPGTRDGSGTPPLSESPTPGDEETTSESNGGVPDMGGGDGTDMGGGDGTDMGGGDGTDMGGGDGTDMGGGDGTDMGGGDGTDMGGGDGTDMGGGDGTDMGGGDGTDMEGGDGTDMGGGDGTDMGGGDGTDMGGGDGTDMGGGGGITPNNGGEFPSGGGTDDSEQPGETDPESTGDGNDEGNNNDDAEVFTSDDGDGFRFRFKRNAKQKYDMKYLNELARKVLISIDGALIAQNDGGECLRRSLCESNKYSRTLQLNGKYWLPMWSLGMSWLSGRLIEDVPKTTSMLGTLKAAFLGLGDADCGLLYGGCDLSFERRKLRMEYESLNLKN